MVRQSVLAYDFGYFVLYIISWILIMPVYNVLESKKHISWLYAAEVYIIQV